MRHLSLHSLPQSLNESQLCRFRSYLLPGKPVNTENSHMLQAAKPGAPHSEGDNWPSLARIPLATSMIVQRCVASCGNRKMRTLSAVPTPSYGCAHVQLRSHGRRLHSCGPTVGVFAAVQRIAEWPHC
jgi:hypothetical protein